MQTIDSEELEHQSDCLNPRQWISQGIMGEILMEIRHELIKDNKTNVASANQDTVTIPPVPDTPCCSTADNNQSTAPSTTEVPLTTNMET